MLFWTEIENIPFAADAADDDCGICFCSMKKLYQV